MQIIRKKILTTSCFNTMQSAKLIENDFFLFFSCKVSYCGIRRIFIKSKSFPLRITIGDSALTRLSFYSNFKHIRVIYIRSNARKIYNIVGKTRKESFLEFSFNAGPFPWGADRDLAPRICSRSNPNTSWVSHSKNQFVKVRRCEGKAHRVGYSLRKLMEHVELICSRFWGKWKEYSFVNCFLMVYFCQSFITQVRKCYRNGHWK